MEGQILGFGPSSAKDENHLKDNIYDFTGIPPCQQTLSKETEFEFNLACANFPWQHKTCSCNQCGPR